MTFRLKDLGFDSPIPGQQPHWSSPFCHDSFPDSDVRYYFITKKEVKVTDKGKDMII